MNMTLESSIIFLEHKFLEAETALVGFLPVEAAPALIAYRLRYKALCEALWVHEQNELVDNEDKHKH